MVCPCVCWGWQGSWNHRECTDRVHVCTVGPRVMQVLQILFILLAVATAAMEMLGGDEAVKKCRKPEIMADAAYAVLTKTGCELTGKFLIDDEILAENGVTDFDQYANVPGKLIQVSALLLHLYANNKVAAPPLSPLGTVT